PDALFQPFHGTIRRRAAAVTHAIVRVIGKDAAGFAVGFQTLVPIRADAQVLFDLGAVAARVQGRNNRVAVQTFPDSDINRAAAGNQRPLATQVRTFSKSSG